MDACIRQRLDQREEEAQKKGGIQQLLSCKWRVTTLLCGDEARRTTQWIRLATRTLGTDASLRAHTVPSIMPPRSSSVWRPIKPGVRI
jgi:hypothetical protein